ncbi:hypothetical protein AMELA_G00004260 [Ameiurus melas]|uniref:Opioid growth factor receptor (OGFr) conserved domain-containing protein n=1 Tax=Ameiurus melas TaxID=219545 RepID=A0A7J6BEW1_AMEME|nr:hypothetical protein AMELA_G00004260 [Ameiurus melas]
MGVFQLLYQLLLFLRRLPCRVFTFIARRFKAMDRYRRSQRQDWVMGNTPNFSKDCDEQYDSTWEDESDDEETRESYMQWSHRNTHAAKDMQTFRHKFQKTQHDDSTDDYLEDDEELPNLQFYQNNKPFYPDGVFIEDFHNNWFGDYNKLEYVHSYIQWLFPIQEKGMNFASRELSLKEIKLFRTDEVNKRLLKSYKLMLDFYGIELVSEVNGKVKRAENWKERFANLNRNTHNNLRITRILKCLGLLGFRHFQKPLVHFFLEETLVNDQLQRVKHSVLDYFMFAVLDKNERKDLIKFAYCHFKPKEDFVWCPKRIRNKLEKETVSHKLNAGSNEGESSDSTSQSDQNDLMNSRVHKKNVIKTDTTEDTSNNKSLSCMSISDKNVSGESQDSEKQASPVPAAGNANTIVTNERTEGPSGVDSQQDCHTNSDDKASIQKDDKTATNMEITNSVQNGTKTSDENGSEYADSTKQSKVLSVAKNFDSGTAIDESTNENQTETSNQSSRIENDANQTPASERNSGSVEQNQGEKAEIQEDKAEYQGDQSENQGHQSENQGDKAEIQEDKAEYQGDKAEYQGDQSENQGDQSENQGDKSENQGDKSENQGDQSENQGDQSENQGDKSENQGDQSKNQGDISQNQGQQSENQGQQSKTKETNLKTKDTNLKTKETNLKTKDNNLKTKDTNLKTKDTNLKTKETNLKTKETNLKTKDNNLKTKDNNLKTKDTNLKTKETNLKTKDNNLKTKDTNLKTKETNLKNKETNLKTKDTNLKTKETNLKPKETNLKTKETNLKTKDNNLKTKDTNLKTKETKLKSKETKLSKAIMIR